MAWFNASWLKRKKVTITETSGSTLSNMSVQLSVTYDADMNSDFSDLRFTAADGTTELGYWIESYTASTSATVWVLVPSLTASSDTDIYMYYGNSGASTTSSGDDAFLYFDEGDERTSWNLGGTSSEDASVGNPVPSYNLPGASGNYMNRDVGMAAGQITTFNMRTSVLGNLFFNCNSSGAGQMFRLESRSRTSSGFASTTSWTSWSAPSGSFTAAANTWYKIMIKTTSATSATLYYEATTDKSPGSQPANTVGTYSYSNNGGYMGLVGDGGGGNTYFDNIITRTYASSDPTSAFGSEEDVPLGPIVTTNSMTNIEETTATAGGNVTDDGGLTVTERGICYNTTGSPTTADTKISTTGTTGSFSINLTGLTEGQQYYLKAYAINSDGTGYGSEVSFSTKADKPTSFTTVEIHNRSISMSWTKGAGAEKTLIRRKLGSYPTGTTDGDEVYFDTGTSVEDSSLTANTQYFYRAWGWDENAGYSDEYSDLTATTLNEYLLTTSISPSGAGSIVADPTGDSGYFEEGASVELTATPTGDYNFWYWSGDLSGNTNPETITMNSNKEISANFSLADYIFQEKASLPSTIDISQSSLSLVKNSSNSIQFRIGHDGEIPLNAVAEYYDSSGNLILDGKIKEAKEVSKDINSDFRIYELTIYDFGYNLIDGNLNEIFRNISPEDLIEDVVEANGLTFVNLLPAASGLTITKKVYKDLDPMEAVNDMCDVLGANWVVTGTTFYLFRRGDFTCSESIDGNGIWAISSDGWLSDTDKQAKKVIIKGASILQRTTETLSGTGTEFYLSRTPEDVEISGLTQTTDSIDGDYIVDKEDKKITFDSSQTDPTVYYSYNSQLRIEVGDGSPIKVLEKSYIEDVAEARKLGRKYVAIYADGIQSSSWLTSEIYETDISVFRVGDLITVYNKINPARDGKYEISKVIRKYPQKIEVQVGEDTLSLLDWQGESKDRLKQLEQEDQNDDFNQFDKFSKGNISVNITSQITKLLIVENTGEILWASDTTLANDADLISDTGADEDYALAYDDSGLPSGSYIDLTP